MAVGTELRQAREQAGFSIEQIADRTKVQLHKIEALENSHFESLPDGIYLDGIVRAYAHEVAINPEPLIERVRYERAQVAGGLDVFDSEEALESGAAESTVVGASAPHHVEAYDGGQVVAPAYVWTPDDEPVIPPTPQEPMNRSRGLGRMALPLVSLLAAAGWGAYLYQANRSADRDATPDIAVSAPQPASPDRNAAQDTTARPDADRPQDQIVSQELAGDVSGSWKLATHVETASYARFAGLHLGYEIQLEQAGDRVTGVGRKVTENGDGLRPRAQTPISVAGTIDGDRLTLAFTERGARRPTQGKFVLLVDEGGTLRGRFSSTAARSSGTVEAHRLR